jgi:glycosyltransferase involved in cell wall biosynthesis
MRVLIVVPAFNEAAALGDLLAELRELSLDGVEITTVVVDDGSRDNTAEIARARGVRVLGLCANLGIGGAVQSGLRLAAREQFDGAIQVDGDGQHPPAELAKLLALVARQPELDLVVGARFHSQATFRTTWLRRLGIAWLRVLLFVVARLRVSDPTSGFRYYGPRALSLFAETYPYDYPEPESLAVARAAGLAVGEVSVTMRPRRGGRSSIDAFASIYYMMKVTLAVVLAYLRTGERG